MPFDDPTEPHSPIPILWAPAAGATRAAAPHKPSQEISSHLSQLKIAFLFAISMPCPCLSGRAGSRLHRPPAHRCHRAPGRKNGGREGTGRLLPSAPGVGIAVSAGCLLCQAALLASVVVWKAKSWWFREDKGPGDAADGWEDGVGLRASFSTLEL